MRKSLMYSGRSCDDEGTVLLDVDSQAHSGCDLHCPTEMNRSLGVGSYKAKGDIFPIQKYKGEW